jgi:hypothetical protein
MSAANAAESAWSAATAESALRTDTILTFAAELAVTVLVQLDTPGSRYL